MKRKNKKFWDYFFLGFMVFWLVLIEVLCIALLEPNYLHFITTIGVFFIPLMSSLGCIIMMLYIFVFKFPTIKDLKNKLAEVYKRDNIHKEDFDIIADGLSKAEQRQKGIEHKEKIEEIQNKKEIQSVKNELVAEKVDVIRKIVQNDKPKIVFGKEVKKSKFDNDLDNSLSSF